MKRQSLVLLAVAFVAAGAAGCFKDPVSSLWNGPAVMSVDHSVVIVHTGDSTSVVGTVKDEGGNTLPATGATWTSTDPTVAVVRNDTLQVIPGDAFTRGFIRGVNVNGGVTTVIVSARNVADTIRVVVLPATLVASHVAFAGPSLTDTVIEPPNALIAGDTAKYYAYTAKDTLILNGTSALHFDTSQVTVTVGTTNGASKGLIVSKTPTQLKVMFMVGTAGRVMIEHLTFTPGNAAVGTVVMDTLFTDSVAVAPIRIGPASFGITSSVASNALSIGFPAGMSVVPTVVTNADGDTLLLPTSAAFAGSETAIVAQTNSSLGLFSTAAATATAGVTVYSLRMAGGTGVDSVTVDSVSSLALSYTLSPATFPMANIVMSPNNGNLGDTLIVTAPAGMQFTTTGDVSQIIAGNTAVAQSDTGWTVGVTAGTLKAFPRRGGDGSVTVTNLLLSVPGAVPFSLATTGTMSIDSIASDWPRGVSLATANVMTIPASNADTVFGAINTAAGPPNAIGATSDFWTFTTSATHAIYAEAGWYGSGNPYGSTPNIPAYTNDIDLTLCDGTMACDETDAGELLGYAAATTAQPESGTSGALAAGTYYVGIALWTPDGARTVAYRLVIQLQ